MSILVTGSAGHLGEALIRSLRAAGRAARGLDILPSPFTEHVGSINDRKLIRACIDGVRTIIHAATLHKPHIDSHRAQEFVNTNVSGTLTLLEEAVRAGVDSFIFTSTTSTFGAALIPPPDEPATWITEDVAPIPKNIYGVTKLSAESLCELFARTHNLATIVLRTSRFFPEPDDNPEISSRYVLGNVQANEMSYRRVDLQDAVSAHLLAIDQAERIGFGKYIVSATTPFTRADLTELRKDAPKVISRLFPEFDALYLELNWKMFPGIDRIYVNNRARSELHWDPKYDFAYVLKCLRERRDFRSPLAREVGSKGYHSDNTCNATLRPADLKQEGTTRA